MDFQYDDGGRAAAGYRGTAGDCVTRAIAIATGLSYNTVYDSLFERGRAYYRLGRHSGPPNVGRFASPRTGVHRKVYEPFMFDLGWAWTPTMSIGSGTRVHLRADELPGGPLVVAVSRHLCAVIDGVLHDMSDCSRGGTRAVYGFYAPGGTCA